MNTKAINFTKCRIQTKRGDSLIYSDIDFSMNIRTNFFLFGEEKEWGKPFNTGIHTDRKVDNPGPILRAKSVINAMNKDAVWVWVWSKPGVEEVWLHECSVVQWYSKRANAVSGTMTNVEDNPIPYLEWSNKIFKQLNLIA